MHDYELYGTSIFETIRANKGMVWRLSQHWQRLCHSAQQLSFQPPNYAAFSMSLLESHDPSQDQVLRLSLMRLGGVWQGQPSGQKTAVLVRPTPPPSRTAVTLFLPKDRVSLCDPIRQHKTGSRIFLQHLHRQAQQNSCSDSLIIDRQSRILETCHSNLLWCHGQRWFTPRLSLGLLPGVYRQWLLQHGLVEESELTLDALSQVEGLLICNSVRGIRQVSMIGRKESQERESAFIAALPTRNFQPLSRVSV